MLSLERYAILRASIEATGNRDAALAKADVLPREWLSAERRWHQQLATEAARGRTDLASRYLAAFNGALGGVASRSAAALPLPSVTPAPIPAPAAPVAAPPPIAPPARAMPSYLASPATPPVARPAVQAAAQPSTGEIDNRRLQRPPMPFVPSNSAAPNTRLPVGPAVAPDAAPGTKAESPAKASQQTAYLDAALLARAPTPFVAKPAVGVGGSVPQSAAPPSSVGTGTAVVDDAQVDLPMPAMPPELPTLTVDQYAWVSASLKRAKSGELEATLTRLRLTPASRASLDAIWKAHMARYPAVKQAFILALAKHLSPQ